MSDSVRPHGQQPTRLLCPQDSPGSNTGLGCHFLLWRSTSFLLVAVPNYHKCKGLRQHRCTLLQFWTSGAPNRLAGLVPSAGFQGEPVALPFLTPRGCRLSSAHDPLPSLQPLASVVTAPTLTLTFLPPSWEEPFHPSPATLFQDIDILVQWSHWSCIGKCEVKVAQSCPTLCDPLDYTVHGILQGRILEGSAFPFSRGSSQPRGQTQVSCIAGGFFSSWATRDKGGVGKDLTQIWVCQVECFSHSTRLPNCALCSRWQTPLSFRSSLQWPLLPSCQLPPQGMLPHRELPPIGFDSALMPHNTSGNFFPGSSVLQSEVRSHNLWVCCFCPHDSTHPCLQLLFMAGISEHGWRGTMNKTFVL